MKVLPARRMTRRLSATTVRPVLHPHAKRRAFPACYLFASLRSFARVRTPGRNRGWKRAGITVAACCSTSSTPRMLRPRHLRRRCVGRDPRVGRLRSVHGGRPYASVDALRPRARRRAGRRVERPPIWTPRSPIIRASASARSAAGAEAAASRREQAVDDGCRPPAVTRGDRGRETPRTSSASGRGFLIRAAGRTPERDPRGAAAEAAQRRRDRGRPGARAARRDRDPAAAGFRDRLRRSERIAT
jgi:hypothetical protein